MTGHYVVVNSNGRAELRTLQGSLLATLESNVDSAYLSSQKIIQINLKNGRVVFYKISESGHTVTGPYMSL